MTGAPQIPIFEATLVLILVVGAIFYFTTERRRVAAEAIAADEATGEATIG